MSCGGYFLCDITISTLEGKLENNVLFLITWSGETLNPNGEEGNISGATKNK